MVEITDKGGQLWISEEWGPRSDQVRSHEGRSNSLLPTSLNFLPSNKDVMFRENEETA